MSVTPITTQPHRAVTVLPWIVAGMGIVLLLLAPAVAYPIFLMKLLCFALFASAFNLLIGYVGLLSFGHATFFGGAAYVTAHAVKVWGFSPELGILLGVAVATAAAWLIGILAIRRQGIYFAMITLSLGQLAYFIFLQAPFTGGEDGIQSVPRGWLFGIFNLADTMTMYYFVATVFVLGMFAVWRIVNSPFGNILKAIRENENRAISLGYRVERYKLGAFMISGALAGLAGSVKTLVFQLATLTDVGWQMSGEVILMTLLGGIGTILGPLAGAAAVLGMQNYLAGTGLPISVIVGSIFVLCVLLFRRGVVGELQALIERMSRGSR